MAANDSSDNGTSRATSRRRKPWLLLVDDEQNVLDALSAQLRRNYEVVRALGAKAALQALAAQQFDIVLSDYRMPGQTGVELLAQVRAYSPKIARVLLTGHADLAGAVAAVNDAAVHRFLTKPCPPKDLAVALEEAMAAVKKPSAGDTELNDKLAKLERLANVGSMAGTVGHEMGNVVTAFEGSLGLIRAQVERGETLQMEELLLLEMLKTRLSDFATNLRDLTKPVKPQREELNLVELVTATASMMRKTGMTRLATIDVETPQAPVYVYGEVAALQSCLINLIKNAAEALDPLRRGIDSQAPPARNEDGSLRRRESPRITISVDTDTDSHAVIIVEDNGNGMSSETASRIFDRHFTTKGDAGTGVGLAVTRDTVEAHGGSIRVASVRGIGTRFVIELPTLTSTRPARLQSGSRTAGGRTSYPPSA